MSVVTLIIIAVLVIFSIIKKKSKTDSEQNIPPNPTPSTPNTWTEILRELGKTETPTPQTVTEKTPDATTPTSPIVEPENMPESKQKETETLTDEKNLIKNTEIKDYKPGYNLNDPNTLRKAIVYAEILNRKYC